MADDLDFDAVEQLLDNAAPWLKFIPFCEFSRRFFPSKKLRFPGDDGSMEGQCDEFPLTRRRSFPSFLSENVRLHDILD